MHLLSQKTSYTGDGSRGGTVVSELSGCQLESLGFDSESGVECPGISVQTCAEKGIRRYRCGSSPATETASGCLDTGRGAEGAVPSVGGEALSSQLALWKRATVDGMPAVTSERHRPCCQVYHHPRRERIQGPGHDFA